MTQGPPQDHAAQQLEAETVAFHHFVAFSLQRYQWLASAPRHYQNLLLREMHREAHEERRTAESAPYSPRLWARLLSAEALNRLLDSKDADKFTADPLQRDLRFCIEVLR